MAKKTAKSVVKKATKGCDCLVQVQEQLKPHGIALETELFVNFTTGKGGVRGPLLRVKKRSDAPKGTKLRTLTCAYCPFCGKETKE